MTDISVEFHYFSLVTLFLLASVKNVQQKISYSLRVLAEVNQWQIHDGGPYKRVKWSHSQNTSFMKF